MASCCGGGGGTPNVTITANPVFRGGYMNQENLVRLEFAGDGAGVTRVTVNGTDYRGANTQRDKYIDVPPADARILVNKGWRAVDKKLLEQLAAPPLEDTAPPLTTTIINNAPPAKTGRGRKAQPNGMTKEEVNQLILDDDEEESAAADSNSDDD